MAYTQKAVKKVSGIHYFAQGWQLISRPGIRRFVILPLLVNILLMGGGFLVVIQSDRGLGSPIDELCP